jgi:hypothetical protein
MKSSSIVLANIVLETSRTDLSLCIVVRLDNVCHVDVEQLFRLINLDPNLSGQLS